ncbi:MAG TPA: SH3 domain-containing protein, partial [Geminicoccaceae bacterium]|nr:SH3 domain-containing protein [Geminicoccaceae bacterium]
MKAYGFRYPATVAVTVALGLVAGIEFRGWPSESRSASVSTQPVATIPAGEDAAGGAGAAHASLPHSRAWLMAALIAALHRNRELEAARVEDATASAELTGELERAEAEARQLRLELALHLVGTEGLNPASADIDSAPDAEEASGTARLENEAGTAEALAALVAGKGRPRPDAESPTGEAATAGSVRYAAAATPVNLRASPRNPSAVLAVVGKGEVVQVFEQTADGWLRVAYSDLLARDVTGWIYGRFLDPI